MYVFNTAEKVGHVQSHLTCPGHPLDDLKIKDRFPSVKFTEVRKGKQRCLNKVKYFSIYLLIFRSTGLLAIWHCTQGRGDIKN